jgi:hypothetical protein|tara:strand:+ start:26596 stop:28824 length:2229 start_codon:yes stop_codon:yes gene_type:complete
MTISVSNNTPRVSYTVAEGQTQTSFTVNFEFFADADLRVFVDNTLKTITTHYTVSGGNGSTGSITMSVTGASGGSTVVIVRAIALERTTDFPTQGAFNISSLNTELDRIIAIHADVDDTAERGLRLQESDDAVATTLPLKDARKGTVLAFNATSGVPEAGPSISSVTTVATQSANINTVAGISANVTTVAGIHANVTTVAGISSNVTTVAGVASNVTTVAGIHANVTTVAGIASDVTAVAGISSDVAAVENIKANVTTVAGISANVTTVAGISSNVTSVAGIASNVTTVAGINTTHLSNVSGVASNVALLGTSDAVSDMNTLAAISSDITSLANSLEKTYTVTVANPGSGNVFVLDSSNAPAIEMFRGNTYIFNQTDSSNDGHPLVFKNGSSAYEVGVTYFLNGSATTQSNYVNTTNFNAGRSSGDRKVQIEVATSAPSSGLRYYCYVHGNGMGNTITVKDSNISLVAGSIANVNTVGGGLTNVNTVAGSISNVNTVATNISGVNSFNERYRVASSAPSSSLDAGDLYFDTSLNELKAYNGSAWQSTAPSAANQTNINIVAGEITAQEDLGSIANAVSTSSGNNINTVGSNITNVNTVAGISSNVTTVAGIASNVTSVAGVASNVTTVANNISGLNSFAERYRVASSQPSSSLDEGDLYYDTTANSLNYYNGSSWVAVVAGAMTSLIVDTTPQLGGNLDVNGNSIVSASNGDITIAPNGAGEINLNGTVNTDNLTIDFGSIA